MFITSRKEIMALTKIEDEPIYAEMCAWVYEHRESLARRDFSSFSEKFVGYRLDDYVISHDNKITVMASRCKGYGKREPIGKEKPMKALFKDHTYYCPRCNYDLDHDPFDGSHYYNQDFKYCPNCGQRLDWGKEGK